MLFLKKFTFSLKNQSGSLNKVGDALNQQVTLLNIICAHVLGFDTFYEMYLNDSSFDYIYAELLEVVKRDNFMLLNNYFFHGLQLDVYVCSL